MQRAMLAVVLVMLMIPQFTYSFSRIDDRTWDIVIKVNGQRRIVVHNVVSEDGKTMRGVSTVVPRNQVIQDVIYERQ